MRVRMRFACPGLFDGVPNGEYETPDSVNIRECVESYASEYGVSLRENWPGNVLVLKDNKPVKNDEIITEDSDVIVVHRILGG